MPSFADASRRASTSAWAVGSPRSSRSLAAAASTSPSRTMTAPIGTSSWPAARSASRSARRMYSSSPMGQVLVPAASGGSSDLAMCTQATSNCGWCYRLKVSRGLAVALNLALAGLVLAASSARADDPPYVPGQVLVHYRGEPGERVIDLPDGITVRDALERLRGKRH